MAASVEDARRTTRDRVMTWTPPPTHAWSATSS